MTETFQITREQAEYRKHAPGRMNIKTVSGGRAVKQERPLTLDEAQADLKKLNEKIDRILDPDKGNVTIETLQRAAVLLGRQLRLELV